MRLDSPFSLSVEPGAAFYSVLVQQQVGFHQCLRSWRDRSLLFAVNRHRLYYSSEFCQDPNSPNSNCIAQACIDEAVGTAVSEGETLVPPNVLKIGLRIDREEQVNALKGDFGRLVLAWAAATALQLCVVKTCIALYIAPFIFHIHRIFSIWITSCRSPNLKATASRHGFKVHGNYQEVAA